MNLVKSKKIAVLLGGLSGERDVSLESGRNILQALLSKGYQAFALDMSRDLASQLKSSGAEIVFNGLHGAYGEDGCVQGLLEILKLPYTGSGVKASALAMDKVLSKLLAKGLGLATPSFLALKPDQEFSQSQLLEHSLAFPLVVKPASEGSSLGLAKVSHFDELKEALVQARKWPGAVLIEQFIQGREVTVAWVDGQVLPVLEIIPEGGFYDYHAKYESDKTRYECPADLSESLASQIQQSSLQLMEAFGVEGAARADFLIDAKGQPYFLEMNTLPGMTSHSLVPKAALVFGLSFEDLVEKILLSARIKQS
ncbi:MAG: D-alanine--D-alanine ligase [Deltaproteobacteria bacterium]|nr:D-alanine--D-alanine ligase [Deltaproteobacteria bacterium]